MLLRKNRYIIILTVFVAILAIVVGCTKPDRSEEATQLKNELHDMLYKNPEQALVRVDSAEQAGIFSAAMSNLLRTNIYGAMGQTRLAVFYGEQMLNDPELKRERRSQVEPRCAERWHGYRDFCGDDEQFDLAAWFLSLFNNHRTAKQFGENIWMC